MDGAGQVFSRRSVRWPWLPPNLASGDSMVVSNVFAEAPGLPLVGTYMDDKYIIITAFYLIALIGCLWWAWRNVGSKKDAWQLILVGPVLPVMFVAAAIWVPFDHFVWGRIQDRIWARRNARAHEKFYADIVSAANTVAEVTDQLRKAEEGATNEVGAGDTESVSLLTAHLVKAYDAEAAAVLAYQEMREKHRHESKGISEGFPDPPLVPQTKAAPVRYLGGTGESIAEAIIISAPSYSAGIRAEYQYIERLCGRRDVDWTRELQILSSEGGRDYDLIVAALTKGGYRRFYFDITSFHSKASER